MGGGASVQRCLVLGNAGPHSHWTWELGMESGERSPTGEVQDVEGMSMDGSPQRPNQTLGRGTAQGARQAGAQSRDQCTRHSSRRGRLRGARRRRAHSTAVTEPHSHAPGVLCPCPRTRSGDGSTGRQFLLRDDVAGPRAQRRGQTRAGCLGGSVFGGNQRATR